MNSIKTQINRFLETFKVKVSNIIKKEKYPADGENNSSVKFKKIESLIIYIIIFSVTLIAVKNIFSSNKHININTNENKSRIEETQLVYSDKTEDVVDVKHEFENSLKRILSNLEGVGKVEVMVTYSETQKTVPIYNENEKTNKTEETDSSGGTRKIESRDISKEVISNENIALEKIVMPKIEGAIIIAEGAKNSTVKNNIISAVEAVSGLRSHKIQVFEMKVR